MAKERFCFVKDDDGHTYMIPADRRREFDKWLETIEDYDAVPWSGYDFEDCRLRHAPQCYSFTDPQIDK